VIARHGGLGEPSDVDLLLLGPDDRCGAVGVGRGVDPPAPQRRFHRTLDLERIKQAADAILREEPLRAGSALEQVEALIGRAGTSMGVARPKTTVEADNALWLAKFPAPSNTWNQPRVEHGLLLLARRCGLQVAESRLTTDRGRWLYLLLADELRRVGAQPAVDLRELFGRICFNAAVSNIDDHPRNHALLARSTSWQLSPAYDLTLAPLQAQTAATWPWPAAWWTAAPADGPIAGQSWPRPTAFCSSRRKPKRSPRGSSTPWPTAGRPPCVKTR
jgi:serine/threonine-protein kinase HipA